MCRSMLHTLSKRREVSISQPGTCISLFNIENCFHFEDLCLHNLVGALTVKALRHHSGHQCNPLACLAYHSFW